MRLALISFVWCGTYQYGPYERYKMKIHDGYKHALYRYVDKHYLKSLIWNSNDSFGIATKEAGLKIIWFLLKQ